MARVITYSRTFPSYHPRAGQPTFFPEKFLNWYWDQLSCPYHNIIDLLIDLNGDKWDSNELIKINNNFNVDERDIKHTTIRAGHRFKTGDMFSPRYWGNDVNPKSGRYGPYHSKQIILAPDIEVKKVWNFEINADGWLFINGSILNPRVISELASNDGLTVGELLAWFKHPKPFSGQIISWSEIPNY